MSPSNALDTGSKSNPLREWIISGLQYTRGNIGLTWVQFRTRVLSMSSSSALNIGGRPTPSPPPPKRTATSPQFVCFIYYYYYFTFHLGTLNVLVKDKFRVIVWRRRRPISENDGGKPILHGRSRGGVVLLQHWGPIAELVLAEPLRFQVPDLFYMLGFFEFTFSFKVSWKFVIFFIYVLLVLHAIYSMNSLKNLNS